MIILYCILGYWATGRTIFRNRILIGTGEGIFRERFFWGFCCGWFLIPWAVISLIIEALNQND